MMYCLDIEQGHATAPEQREYQPPTLLVQGSEKRYHSESNAPIFLLSSIFSASSKVSAGSGI